MGRGPRCASTHQDGRLVALAHTGGKRVSFEWEGERIVSASCSDGRHVEYAYDDGGDLVEANSITAGPRRYELDADGRIVSVTDADGVCELVNTYDEHGLVSSRSRASAGARRSAISPGRSRSPATSRAARPTPTSTTARDGCRRSWTATVSASRVSYDDWGNPVAVTERNGAVTVQEWDERSRLTRRTLPSGASYAFRYDDADRVVEVALSTGEVTRFRYEGDERSPAETVDPEGGVTRMSVVDGRVREVVDPDGVRVRFDFDDDGKSSRPRTPRGTSPAWSATRPGA